MDLGTRARRVVAAGTLSLSLAGRVTGEELARWQAEQRRRQLDEDRQTCMAHGIHPGQGAFAGCTDKVRDSFQAQVNGLGARLEGKVRRHAAETGHPEPRAR